MLIPNVLFRANGSAVLLSNKRRDVRRSKYCIRNVVRTHLANDDVAYNCVIQMEDAERNVSTNLFLTAVSCACIQPRSSSWTAACPAPPVRVCSLQIPHASSACAQQVFFWRGASARLHAVCSRLLIML